MAWQSEMVTMLRVLINDMDSECYDDVRLEQLLVLSAKYVKALVDKGPCAAYDALKLDYQFGNTNTIRAVLSPFVGNNFDPSSLSSVPRWRS
jgi:hypothetical protein